MRKYNIVIVENDEDEQLFMKEGLEQSGHFTVVAQLVEGSELLDWLNQNLHNLPDLILSDLNMPGKNGHDILQGVLSLPACSHLPVVITSTSNLPSVQEKCLSSGAAGFMVKPESFIDYVPYANDLYRNIQEKHWVKEAASN